MCPGTIPAYGVSNSLYPKNTFRSNRLPNAFWCTTSRTVPLICWHHPSCQPIYVTERPGTTEGDFALLIVCDRDGITDSFLMSVGFLKI